VGPDHIEISSFIGLAAVTGGAVTIDGVHADDLRSTLLAFERLGVRPRIDGSKLIVDAGQERRIRPDLGGHVPKLEDGPWPAFPADLMSIAIVVATQCEGLLLVFEEAVRVATVLCRQTDRYGCADRALRSASRGHCRTVIWGQVMESPDIRAGMAMVLAALAAQGDSVIYNIGQIERGYERIDERLIALGAQLERREGR
jgi:UDP-N-acetylglucosamine 1-carboxyvinyltransferase